MLNIKFTPESFIMLPFALILDLIGIGLIVFGIPDDFGVTDIIGILFFTPWLLLRGDKSFDIKETKQKAKNIFNFLKNCFTGKTSKFFTASILELIPVLGSIFPFWTLSVLFNLSEEE